MVNAWSLLDSVINGTLEEDYPIMSGEYKSYREVPHPENFNEDITFRTDGYPGSIEDSQSLSLHSGPPTIRFGDSVTRSINNINNGTSTPKDIDIYCDFLSKYDV